MAWDEANTSFFTYVYGEDDLEKEDDTENLETKTKITHKKVCFFSHSEPYIIE